MGNLDNMMQAYETIQKVESRVESVLRKIGKAYGDVEPNGDLASLKVESKAKGPGNFLDFFKQKNIFVDVFLCRFDPDCVVGGI